MAEVDKKRRETKSEGGKQNLQDMIDFSSFFPLNELEPPLYFSSSSPKKKRGEIQTGKKTRNRRGRRERERGREGEREGEETNKNKKKDVSCFKQN